MFRLSYYIRIKKLLLIHTGILISLLCTKAGKVEFEKFDRYSINEGLSQATVTFIFQDSDGFIWIGTEDGLNKFDGYSFRVFQNNPANSESIGNNIIHYINQDINDNLWVVNEASVDLYDKNRNSFKHFFIHYDSISKRSRFTDSASNIKINEALQDKNGNFWLYNGHQNTIIYCNAKQKIIYQKVSEIVSRAIPLENVTVVCIFEDSRGNVLFGTLEKGIFLFNPETSEVINISKNKSENNILKNSNISHITEDNDGNYWISTYGGGVNIYNPETGYFKEYSKKTSPVKLNSDYIFYCLVKENGDVLIGTDGGGLNYLSASDSSVRYVVNDDKDDKSISNNVVRFIYEDDFENIWVGNYKGGVNAIKNRKGKNFKTLYHKPDKYNSLTNNNITAILLDDQNYLWLGTDGGGLNVFNEKKEKIYPFNGRLEKLHDIILAVFQDSKKRIWVGTYMDGIYMLDLKKQNIKHYTFAPEEELTLFYDDIRAIQEDDEGNIWLGTQGVGVIVFNPETGTKKIFRQPNQSKPGDEMITNDWITNINRDQNDNLWISSFWGLTRYDCKTHKFYRYFSDNLSGSELLNNNTLCVHYSTSSKYLWVGTRDGLYKYNFHNNKLTLVKHFTLKDGLPSNFIHSILEDSKGNLWLGTNNGISKLLISNKKFRNYNSYDGLRGNYYNTGSCYKSANGELYFGGVQGLDYFLPEEISDDTTRPTVLLTRLLLMNKEVEIGQEYNGMKILDKDISLTSNIVLSYKENIITFEFVGLHYSIPEKNRYAYKLENFDEAWHEVGPNTRFATYTNLDPGNYVFRVKASNCDDIWNEEGVSLAITIKPPFWKTILFRIVVFIFIIGIISLIYFYRVYLVQQRNIMLEKLVKERTRTIEEKNKILHNQKEDLNEINLLLEERQKKVEELAKKLIIQRDKLEDYNKELKEVNSTKDKFFSIIAHDLKNPFNALLGFCELLQLKYDSWDDEKRRKIIDAIFESSSSIYALLNNLLQWSKTQQGTIKYMPVSIPLDDFIANNVNILKESAERKNISIVKEIENGETMLLIDVNFANTVLRNLLANAIKFTHENGRVIIKNKMNHKLMKISVIDNGVGINRNIISKLFTIGESFNTPGTNKEKGTGLGLILCKEFIEKMGGKITVNSKEGEGSEFTIWLPVSD